MKSLLRGFKKTFKGKKNSDKSSGSSSSPSGSPKKVYKKEVDSSYDSQTTSSPTLSSSNSKPILRENSIKVDITTPLSELPNNTAPKSRLNRRRSSIARDEFLETHNLPPMSSIRVDKSVGISDAHRDLFKKKLEMCSVIFRFENASPKVDTTKHQPQKDAKRETLVEIMAFVDKYPTVLNEMTIGAVFNMLSKNLFRSLPPEIPDYDPEEDGVWFDPAWPHLEVIYEFFLRITGNNFLKQKVAKSHLSKRFLQEFIQLFSSQDCRERDYVKTILHRVYGKFMYTRKHIRLYMGLYFQEAIYLHEHSYNGLQELLTIYGSVVTGFAKPVKPEHINFFRTFLLPLMKAPSLEYQNFNMALTYCIHHFIKHDCSLIVEYIQYCLRVWPWNTECMGMLMGSEEMDDHVHPMCMLTSDQGHLVFDYDVLKGMGKEIIAALHVLRVEGHWNDTALEQANALFEDLQTVHNEMLDDLDPVVQQEHNEQEESNKERLDFYALLDSQNGVGA
eukprot:g546.t1